MKRRKILFWLIPILVLLALGVGLYFVHPLAPLALLLSLLIQLPIIFLLAKSSLNSSYRDRAYQRRQLYLKDGDAEALWEGERKEAASVGYRYWSRGTKTLCQLNQAEALVALDRHDEAAEHLALAEEEKLDSHSRERFDAVVQALRARGGE